MHTTSNPDQTRTELRTAKAKFELTMLRVQTKALETLERCMDEPESSGDPRKDAADARERNRQRLSATQTLIHCRTMAREMRLSQAQRWNRKDELLRREAGRRRTLEVARSLHKDCPDVFPDPDAPASPPSPPRGRRWSCAASAQERMRGRPEPSDHPDITTSGCAADPSPQPSPARSIARGEGAGTTIPFSPGAAAQAEGAGHADNGSARTPLSGSERLEALNRKRDEQRARRRAEALAAEPNALREP